jgi:hypothetical protein
MHQSKSKNALGKLNKIAITLSTKNICLDPNFEDRLHTHVADVETCSKEKASVPRLIVIVEYTYVIDKHGSADDKHNGRLLKN